MFIQQPHDIDHVIPKKIKKEQQQQQLQLKKDKRTEMAHLPLLPLPLHRQMPRKDLTFKDKEENLEGWLKKIKSASKEAKKTKDPVELAKPNHETKESNFQPPSPKAQVKEKRKPGRPGKKKINN